MTRSKLKRRDIIALTIISVVWVFLQLPHLQLDPWNDELYTLQHFVVAPLATSVADYHVPNNHILFSLCLNLFRRAIGIGSTANALDHIWLLRLLPLAFSIGTIACVYLTAGRRGGFLAALLAAMLLMGSVPFFNYACQLRGYGLSMLLFALLVSQILCDSPKPVYIAMTAAGLIWVLPSNLYILLSLVAGFSIVPPAGSDVEGARRPLRNLIVAFDDQSPPGRPGTGAALVAGMFIGALLYLPVFSDLISFNSSRPSGTLLQPFTQTLPVVLWHFLSGRWLLLIPPLAYVVIRIYKRQIDFPERLLLFSIITLLGPFACSAIRGDGAPDRVFLTGLPLVCLTWGMLAAPIGDRLKLSGKLVMLGFYALCCSLALFFGWQKGARKVLTDLSRNERCADLYYQYYLHDYTPQADARRFARSHSRRTVVVNAAVQDVELAKYLQFAGVEVLPPDSLRAYARRGEPVYAICEGPRLMAGPAAAYKMAKMPGSLRQPGIYQIRWRGSLK